MFEMINTIANETFTDDDRRNVIDFLRDIVDTVDAQEDTLYRPFILSLELLIDAMDE